MSLVNDMLRDLEKRKAAEQTSGSVSDVSRESMIEPRQRRFSTKDISLALMILLIAALVIYIVMSGEAQNSQVENVNAVASLNGTDQNLSVEVAEETSLKETVQPVLPNPPSIASDVKPSIEKNTAASDESPATEKVEPEVVSAELEPVQKTKTAKLEKKAIVIQPPESKKQNLPKAKEGASLKDTDKVKDKRDASDKLAVKEEAELKERVKPKKEEQSQQQNKVVLSPAALDVKTASDAVSLFELGKPTEAYQLMQEFVINNETIDKTLGLLANRLLQDQRLQELSALFERTPGPIKPELRQVKARWFLMEGKPELAIELLEQARPDIELLPEYYALLASLYQRNNQAGKAFETYSQLIQSNDIVADWWAGLGIAADQLRQERQALFAYQQAISLPGLNGALEQYIRQRVTALSAEM